MAALGAGLLETSRIDEGVALLTDALSRGPSESGKAQIDLWGQLARGHLFRADGAAGLAAVERALEAAERLNYHSLTLNLLITKSWALGHVGRHREGIALLTGAMALADQEDDLSARLRSRFNLSGTLLLDDPRRALKVAYEGIELDERFGYNAASMAGNAASCALIMGDLDAVFRLEAGISESDTTLGAFIRGDAACAAALRGDFDGAEARMQLVERAVAEASSAQDLRELRHEQALIAFAAGRLDEARKLADEAVDLYPTSAGAIAARALGAHVSILQGRPEQLDGDRAWLAGNQSTGAWVQRAVRAFDAAAAALAGNVDEASRLYRPVIAEWRDNELWLDLGLTLLERAILLGAVDGEAEEGRAEAVRVFAAMGAEGLVDRLSAAAVRPAAATRSPARQSEDAAATRR